LPLFGSGDWNDGMNLVGIGGKGESVWLAMFLSHVLERFAPVCEAHGEAPRAQQYREEARKLKEAVDASCWDGEWYLRGFYDDGAPFGGGGCGECRIDLLPQSFAAICGMPDNERRRRALDSALALLCDERLQIVRLFEPAFDHGGRNPGYVKAYPPGIRENGGQYTHAAVWLAIALLLEGRVDDGYRILSMLNPASKDDDAAHAQTYRLEPYFFAGDIYSNPSCEGRGGWSLYTGAAAWYYRAVLENLLGIRLRGNRIFFSPALPSHWPGYEAEIRLRGTILSVRVTRGEQDALRVDGEQCDCAPLDGKKHQVEMIYSKSPQNN
ncbi:MAG: glycosyl hydrolase family 65 protein, partial [Clostridia bacterium]|nr:glycosyl hydrolase family 65 protein [Clostridia bacterium]